MLNVLAALVLLLEQRQVDRTVCLAVAANVSVSVVAMLAAALCGDGRVPTIVTVVAAAGLWLANESWVALPRAFMPNIFVHTRADGVPLLVWINATGIVAAAFLSAAARRRRLFARSRSRIHGQS
jgi:hypothetical protein